MSARLLYCHLYLIRRKFHQVDKFSDSNTSRVYRNVSCRWQLFEGYSIWDYDRSRMEKLLTLFHIFIFAWWWKMMKRPCPPYFILLSTPSPMFLFFVYIRPPYQDLYWTSTLGLNLTTAFFIISRIAVIQTITNQVLQRQYVSHYIVCWMNSCQWTAVSQK